ncbi:MAG: hypothetical protein B6241_09945 [Spirochaetaceae bacterium 4572_59]|nr:MAG: hypothetical protein B6241_09945 [Spirochaetaceae bacterium 4572_59]
MKLNFVQAYPRTFKRWVTQISKDPGSWIQTSLIILLLSIPVITWGFAYGFGHVVSYRRSVGYRIKLKIEISEYFHSKQARNCFLMGILDILVLGLTICTLRSLIIPEASKFSRIISSLFIWFDLVYWMSSLYRYPIMALDRESSFSEGIVQSLFLTVTKLGHSMFFLLFKVSILIVSLVTGIGIFVFFLGSLSLLNVHHWLEVLGDDQIATSFQD